MKFRKTKAIEVEELDITSLLDILVILLVFLLQSFNSSDLTIDLAEKLALPYSDSNIYGRHGPILQLNSNKEVWLDDEKLGDLDKLLSGDLVRRLVVRRESIKKEMQERGDDISEVLFINLLFDKDLDYGVIDTVLKKCAESGFGKYKFIVQSDK